MAKTGAQRTSLLERLLSKVDNESWEKLKYQVEAG